MVDRSRAHKRARWSLSTVLVALVIAAIGTGLFTTGGLGVLAQEGTPDPTDSGSTVLDDAGSIADVAERANPAVVTIRAIYDLTDPFADGVGQQPADDPFAEPNDPFNQPPFGDDRSPFGQVIPTSSGSGFIIDEDGHVVSNNHVVAGATEFEVELYDGTVVPATLVGGDAFSDIAVLKLDLPNGVTVPSTLPLGDSDTVRVGDQVIAIGTPLGEYTNTVSAGIVGGKDRSLDTGAGYRLQDLIQHDAPVYQGNSGGPLLNAAGEVIGVNTAKAANAFINATDADIAFAISINAVKEVISDLITTGEIVRPYLGIEGRPLADGHGVLQIAPDSPAADAGLERGDIITEIDGRPVDPEQPLANLLYEYEPGDVVTLTVERDGTETELTVTLEERAADAA